MISKPISLQKAPIIIFMGAVLRLHKQLFASYYYFVGPVLVPIYEFLIYPLVYRYLPKVNAIGKFFIGGVLYFGWYVIFLALITYARMHYIATSTVNSSSNATLPCLFHGSADFLGDTLDHKIVIVFFSFTTIYAHWSYRILVCSSSILYERFSGWNSLWLYNFIHRNLSCIVATIQVKVNCLVHWSTQL